MAPNKSNLFVMCYIFSTTSRQPAVGPSTESDTTASEQSSGTSSDSLAPAGMSQAAVNRVKGDSPLEPNKLEQVVNTYSSNTKLNARLALRQRADLLVANYTGINGLF